MLKGKDKMSEMYLDFQREMIRHDINIGTIHNISNIIRVKYNIKVRLKNKKLNIGGNVNE